MTTRKHSSDGSETEGQDPPMSPIEARLQARIAQQQAGEQAAQKAETDSALAEARDRYLRLAADFENYKKRSRQEQLDTIQHASADLISRLLPVLDDLRAALEHAPRDTDEAWLKGIELSTRKLEDVLAAHGLEPIESVGSAFNPKFHEAVGHEESDDHPDDTVVSELRRGYRIRDRVVRPSLVKVSRRPELPAGDQNDRPDF
jgi:molecular chaperone GrpE